MDESLHLERRAFRRRSLVAFAASIALHCAFFALVFCLAAVPPGATGPLAISLLSGEAGQAGIASPSASRTSLRGSEAGQGVAPAEADGSIAPASNDSDKSGVGDGASRTNAGGNEIRSLSHSDSRSDAPGLAGGAVPAHGAAAPGGSSAAGGAASAAAGEGTAVGGIAGDGGAAEAGRGNTSARGAGDPAAALAAQVLAAVEARKTYPDAARRRGTEGIVRLRFSVAGDGRLLAAKLVASSGSALLDRSALDLFASVFPVDNAARREIDDLALSISYNLERR
jgi:TonB family protein